MSDDKAVEETPETITRPDEPSDEILRPDPERCAVTVAEMGSNIMACYQCGKCSAGCPVAEMTDLLPHRVIRLAQLGQRGEILRARHIWLCTGCGTCTERCPNQVDVAGVMDRLKAQAYRSTALAEDAEGAEAARFHRLFLESIQRFGRAHEFGVLRRLRGIGGMMKDMALGMQMMRKGKIKMRASKVEDREKIRELYRRVEEEGEP